jgi:hypothetical protein
MVVADRRDEGGGDEERGTANRAGPANEEVRDEEQVDGA